MIQHLPAQEAERRMPIQYERDDLKHRIVETSRGTVTLGELIGVVERQVADEAWAYTVLADARGVISGPSAAEMHEFVLRIGALTWEHGPRGRTALVVSDDLLASNGERFAQLSELTGLEVRVFRTVDLAEHWLQGDQDA